uniref:Uncharacterized protein n=1 Tax=Eutreptiella gymnastica TaxID=73025 RepID=A0A7S1NPK0_9EUGL|mmetsp:Transcript_67514/g.119726  ORF Transcript_67514/g.119726 Transcript_67514/m.119726 type:complete len:604 (+) Transcript_67514:857-2668(+)
MGVHNHYDDNDDICVSFEDTTRRVNAAGDLHSFLDCIETEFELLPSQFKLVYQVDIRDEVGYMQFLRQNIKFLRIVEMAPKITPREPRDTKKRPKGSCHSPKAEKGSPKSAIKEVYEAPKAAKKEVYEASQLLPKELEEEEPVEFEKPQTKKSPVTTETRDWRKRQEWGPASTRPASAAAVATRPASAATAATRPSSAAIGHELRSSQWTPGYSETIDSDRKTPSSPVSPVTTSSAPYIRSETPLLRPETPYRPDTPNSSEKGTKTSQVTRLPRPESATSRKERTTKSWEGLNSESDVEESDPVLLEEEDAMKMISRVQDMVYTTRPLSARHQELRQWNTAHYRTPPIASAQKEAPTTKFVEPDAGVRAAAVTTEQQEKISLKNDKACLKVARDACLLEDLEAEVKALMKEPKQAPIFMPKPPTSTYEACHILGVETASLAALSPPNLKSPRYRTANSPTPCITEQMANAAHQVQKTAGLVTGPRPASGRSSRALRCSSSPRRSSKERIAKSSELRVFTMEDRCNYSKLLSQQCSELDSLVQSHQEYNKMMDEYSREQATMFAKQREFVEKGGHFFPLDDDTRTQLKLARMIGIAPDDPTGLA